MEVNRLVEVVKEKRADVVGGTGGLAKGRGTNVVGEGAIQKKTNVQEAQEPTVRRCTATIKDNINEALDVLIAPL